MKKSIILTCFIILSVLSVGLSPAENPVISVVGKGVVKVQADVTTITVGVDSKKDNRPLAESEVQQKLNNTKDALLAAGVNKDEIIQGQAANILSMQSKSCKTINNTTTCEYSNLSRLERTLIVQMKTTDQSKINNALHAAKDAGANASVTGYGLSDQEGAMKQALDKADENAKAKAEAYASGEGLRLGKMLERNEIPPMLCSTDDLSSLSLDSSSEPGIVNVRACVEVTYELLR
jgi:uncharacterized protein YggE